MSKELQRVFDHLHQARREVSAAIKCCSDERTRAHLKDLEETIYGELGDVLDRLETRGAA